MQLLEPLRIVHVRLAARNVLDVARVHQQHLEAARLKDLEHRNPVHACRFHGDGGDADRREPIRQLMKIAAEASKRADWSRVPLAGHRDDMEGRADIDAGRM